MIGKFVCGEGFAIAQKTTLAQKLRPTTDKWDLIKLKSKQSSEEAHRVEKSFPDVHPKEY